MSQHRVEANGHLVVVGWDPPLQTYFAQVWDDGEVSFWTGAGVGVDRIADVATLEELLRGYVTLEETLLRQLVLDKEGP